LFLTHLGEATDLDSVSQALMKTMREIEALYQGRHEKPTALNLFVTDGKLTAVTRHGKSLWHAERPGLPMIASEPVVDGEPWAEIPEDHLLTLDEQMRARLSPIPL